MKLILGLYTFDEVIRSVVSGHSEVAVCDSATAFLHKSTIEHLGLVVYKKVEWDSWMGFVLSGDLRFMKTPFRDWGVRNARRLSRVMSVYESIKVIAH